MNLNKLLNVLVIIVLLASTLEGLALIKGIDGTALRAVIGVFGAIAGIIGTVLTYKIKHHHDQKRE